MFLVVDVISGIPKHIEKKLIVMNMIELLSQWVETMLGGPGKRNRGIQ